MKICVIGIGYVGLVTGVCLSDFGHTVFCIDNDKKKISNLKAGVISIFEPGLETLLDQNISARRLFFSSEFEKYVKKSDVVFVAVGTPERREDGNADLSHLYNVFEKLKFILDKDQVVIIKSTVPIGTNTKISRLINKDRVGNEVEIVSNPEFLREGSALEDFMRPDRVIIGTNSKKAEKIMEEVYRPLYLRDLPIMMTSPQSAELIKYASNAFLATKVAFINEIAHLSEKVEADVKDVAKGMGLDRRIGPKFLHAGPGFGGSCFPKDISALAEIGKGLNAPQTIVDAVAKANERTKERMFEKILQYLLFKRD